MANYPPGRHSSRILRPAKPRVLPFLPLLRLGCWPARREKDCCSSEFCASGVVHHPSYNEPLTVLQICGSTDALILPLVLLLFENSQLLLSRRSPLRISDYSTVRGLTYIVVYQQLSQTALWIVDEWLLSELPSDRPDGQASGIRNLGSASVGGTGSHGQDVQGQCDHAATPSAEESSTPSATQSSSTPKDLSTSPIKPDCGSCVRGTAQSSLKSSKESGQGQKSRVSPDLGPSTAPPPDRENGASTDKPGSQRRYSRPGRGESMVLPISANGVTMNYWASCEPLPTPCLAREGDLRIFPELGPSSRLSRYSNCVRTKARATLRKAKKAIQDLGHNLPEPVDSVLKRLWAIATEMSRMARSFVAPSFAALVLATIVNSIPDLQDLFFRDDAFLQNSLVSAAEQVADLAVPTWLVLLGCRGSRSSTTCSPSTHVAQRGGESRLIFISLVSRMLLPVLFTGLFLALLTGNELALVFNDPSFSVVGILAAGSPIARELLHIFEEKNICQNIVPQIAHQAWSVGYDTLACFGFFTPR